MRLKRSTSSSSTPVQTAVSGRSSRASSDALEPRAVGEAGQRVGLRLTLGLGERDLERVGHAACGR